MIIPEAATPSAVAGTVSLWSHEAGDQHISEIGWMVLPAFQGQGYGKRAVRTLLEMAREDGRWGLVHAFPQPATCLPMASAAVSASRSLKNRAWSSPVEFWTPITGSSTHALI
ncbi:GNAT family N-acetyltransferase [Streptomyces sp. NPDC056921]|uniref:GNAT family N-acetyltransferase n=1 Tax=Streptomyces sp. NPDC056921 TaxID=3345966 RepID=UPI0036421264